MRNEGNIKLAAKNQNLGLFPRKKNIWHHHSAHEMKMLPWEAHLMCHLLTNEEIQSMANRNVPVLKCFP